MTDNTAYPTEPVTLLRLAIVILRHRMIVVVTTTVFFVLAAVTGLVADRTYTATASFFPQAGRSSSPVSGLAAQFGIAVPTGAGTTSPQFYVELLQSRAILEAVASRRDSVGGATPTNPTVMDLLKIVPGPLATRSQTAVRLLGSMISSSVSIKSGVVSMSVKSTDANLSTRVAEYLVDEVGRFNLQTRQAAASAERKFAEQRLAEAERELATAESQLQAFQQGNRDARHPTLVFDQEKLTRKVVMRQQLYTSLAQAYEQAKLDEVRDTPVITIIERPEFPTRPDSRGLLQRGFLALILGGIFGTFLAFAREYFLVQRSAGGIDDEEFNTLRQESITDVRNPLRAVRRWLARDRTA